MQLRFIRLFYACVETTNSRQAYRKVMASGVDPEASLNTTFKALAIDICAKVDETCPSVKSVGSILNELLAPIADSTLRLRIKQRPGRRVQAAVLLILVRRNGASSAADHYANVRLTDR